MVGSDMETIDPGLKTVGMREKVIINFLIALGSQT
jgi:hypothetical protein